MIKQELFSPEWSWSQNWHTYALATGVRLLHYARIDQLQKWRVWAGADDLQFIPAQEPEVSSACVFKDADSAIIMFEGTRNFEQVKDEILYACPTFDPAVGVRSHSFFHWCFRQHFDAVRDAVLDLPPTAKIMVTGHSLGGAIAHIWYTWAKKVGFKNVVGCVTFGQPRTFAPFRPHDDPTYLRVKVENDPIPTLPFDRHFYYCVLQPAVTIPLAAVYDYQHNNQALNLHFNGDVIVANNYFFNEAFSQFYDIARAGFEIQAIMNARHTTPVYCDLLEKTTEGREGGTNLRTLHELNIELTALDRGVPLRHDDVSSLQGVGMWVDPDLEIPANGELPTIPAGHTGRIIEQRSAALNVSSFTGFFPTGGGSEMAAHSFKSHDRALLTTLKKVCNAIIARDARTDNPKPTRKLSNRLKMFAKVTVAGVLVHPLEAIAFGAQQDLDLPG